MKIYILAPPAPPTEDRRQAHNQKARLANSRCRNAQRHVGLQRQPIPPRMEQAFGAGGDAVGAPVAAGRYCMTCTSITGRGFSAIVCTTPDFKPGDQAPEGYLAWHEWAEVQHKAGLRQKQCGRCGKWKYPQELSDKTDPYTVIHEKKGLLKLEAAVCVKCAANEVGVFGISG